MAAIVLRVCFVVLWLIPCVIDAYIKEYSMADYCGRKLDVGFLTTAIKLKLTYVPFSGFLDCGMHIETFSYFNDNTFFLQFLDYDIHCNNHLKLYDGTSNTSSEVGSQICGKNKPPPFTTSSGDVYIRFTREKYIVDYNSEFTLLITSFYTGVCELYEYRCNNGRCIDEDLYCNGYDNCGDDSDYCYKDWWIWLIVSIVVFLIVCVVVTVVCCRYCTKKTTGVVMNTRDQPVVHYQNGNQTVMVVQANALSITPTQQRQGAQRIYQTPPAYTNASGSSVYPTPQTADPALQSTPTAPPSYSEIMSS